MSIRVVVPPVVEPVATAEALLWCRAPDADAPLIDTLIQAARERAEHTTQRTFVQRTMELVECGFYPWPDYDAQMGNNFNRFGVRRELVLATAPVQSIESITYLDRDGAEQTLPTAAYRLDASSEPGVLRYSGDYMLPSVLYGRSDGVRIRFVAGYPPDLTNPDQPDYRKNLPAAVRTWMQVQISTWYTQRESLESTGRLTEISRNYIEALLDGLIVSTRFV